MAYNVLKGNVQFINSDSGSIESMVDDYSDQTIGGIKTFSGIMTASVGLSSSAYYGDGTGLFNLTASKVIIANDGDNRVLTSTGASALNAEQNMQFDGSTLSIIGDISASINVSGTAFYGSAIGLTNVPAAALDGNVSAANIAFDTNSLNNNSGNLEVKLSSSSGLESTTTGIRINTSLAVVKASPANNDRFIISDSADSNNPKHMLYSAISTAIASGITTYPPGGSDTEIQFKNGSAFNGDSNLTFNGTTDTLTTVNITASGDVGVGAKVFHVGDEDTYIDFTTDDINFQAGGVNFLDLTEDTQNEVTFNEGGVDIDFRVETADESHMLFIEGSSNRMSIGDNTGSPGATLEIKNHASAGATGVPLLQLNNNDTDQQCVDINAGNIDANVVNITANDVTTARVLAIGADGLTTGNAIYVDDNSPNTGTRNTALIIQNHTGAINAKALVVQSDGGTTGVKIDKNYSDLTEASIVGLDIDWDKTGASTSDNTMYGIQLDMDNTTATDGTNYMYGLYVTPTLTHAANAGSSFVYGALINAQGGTNGTAFVQGVRIEAGGGDINYGIQLDVEDGGVDLRIESSADNGDYFQIQTTTHGATTFTTVDDNATAAHLTCSIDGNIVLDPAGGVVSVDGNLSASINISASAFYGDGSNLQGVGGGSNAFDAFTANFNVIAEHDFIAVVTTGSAITASLPAASTFDPGKRFTFKDVSGSCSGSTNHIVISASAYGSGNRVDGQGVVKIQAAYGAITITSDGVGQYYIASTS